MLKIGFILNTIFYCFTLVSFFLGYLPASILCCLAGLCYNVWCLIHYSRNTVSNSEDASSKYDRNLIMEDLDREAERRREFERLKRN